MGQQDNVFSVRLVKKNGKLTHQLQGELALFKSFVDTLEEAQIVEVFFEAHKNDGTKPQLAKIHACIRKLAIEIGYTFEEMKLEIKRRAGLSYGDLSTSEGYVKSFADCSKEELALVIESLNEAGNMVNLEF